MTGASGDPGSGSSGAAPNVVGVTPVVAEGDAGPYAGYDPSVHFDWPESNPTSGGGCKAGHHTGSFIGIYSPSIAVAPVPIPVAGNLDLTLDKSADGEFFTITGGKLSGVADGLFPFSADVSGTLNCKTSKLENGALSNGVYIVGVIPFNFEGPFPGTYEQLTHSFTGTWHVYEPKMTMPLPAYGGQGTWTTSLVGP